MYSAVHDLIIDDQELRVFSNGTGTPVLMLHDLGGSAAAFEHLTPPLVAAGRELVAVDLPGCGHSDPVGDELDAYVRRLIEAMPHLAEEPMDVLGHGFGGYLAASIAAEQPELVRRLILVEPTVPPRSGGKATMRMSPSMALSGAVTTLRRGKLRQNLTGFSRARAVLERLARPDPEWWESLEEISAITVIFDTEAAELGERALLDLLAAAIPGSRRGTIAGGKRPHAASPVSFVRELLDFLAEP